MGPVMVKSIELPVRGSAGYAVSARKGMSESGLGGGATSGCRDDADVARLDRYLHLRVLRRHRESVWVPYDGVKMLRMATCHHARLCACGVDRRMTGQPSVVQARVSLPAKPPPPAWQRVKDECHLLRGEHRGNAAAVESAELWSCQEGCHQEDRGLVAIAQWQGLLQANAVTERYCSGTTELQDCWAGGHG